MKTDRSVVEAPPFNDEKPETVRDPRVPREVREELMTEEPRVVAERILALFIRYEPPVARFRFPEERDMPPEKVEVAPSPTIVVVDVLPKKPLFSTDNAVVEAPPFNDESPVTVRVPVAVSDARDRLPEKRESPWTESLDEGVVVPMPTEPPVVAR